VFVANNVSQVIEGVYFDQRSYIYNPTAVFVLAAEADSAQIDKISHIFQLSQHHDAGADLRLAKLEANLELTARRIEELGALIAQPRLLHLPQDEAGLLRLKAEIDARLEIHAAEGKMAFQGWRWDVPSRAMELIGYRFQDRRFGVGLPLQPRRVPTRFSDGSFAAVYAAEDLAGAVLEATGLGRMASENLRGFISVRVRARCLRVLDLTDPATREHIEAAAPGTIAGVSMAPNWLTSHAFGSALSTAGFDACIYLSRRSIGRRNFVIFPQNIGSNMDVIGEEMLLAPDPPKSA
jgi:RES domain-containing protein